MKLITTTFCLIALLFHVLEASPLWNPPAQNLGSLGADGGLHRQLPVGQLRGSEEFSFPITLQHRMQRNQGGFSVVSEWYIPQLSSFVAPQGRNDIVWVEPGGAVHRFAKKNLQKRAKQPLPRGWTAVDEGNANYSFHSQDGWVYSYEKGLLKSLTAPSGRKMDFETDGGRITKISQKSERQKMDLLSAKYDAEGKPTEITIGQTTHRFAYDKTTKLLGSWEASSRPKHPLLFQYEDRLLNAIRLPDGRIENYKWEKERALLGKQFKDLKIPRDAAPAILIADDDYLYRFGLNDNGINLIRQDKIGRIDYLIFNPRTGEKIVRDAAGGENIFIWNGEREKTGAGLLKEVRSPDGRPLVQYQYDKYGRISARKQAGNVTEIFEYDDEGRLIGSGRPGQKLKTFEYEKNARKPSKITDALGGTEFFEYNNAGQVTRYKDKRDAVHKFRYDDFGRLIEREYPYGHTIRFKFDGNGQLTERISPDGSVTLYEYDVQGRLTGTKNKWETSNLTYDDLGRVQQVSANGSPVFVVERTPTSGGERIAVTGPDGKVRTREVDERGKILKEIDPLGQEIEVNYDPAGQLTGWTDPRGVEATLKRDETGNVTGISDSLGNETSMNYDPAGRLRNRQTEEQSVAYRYDREGRVRDVRYAPKEQVKYKYDDYGRITEAATTEATTTYAYDALDRVIGEQQLLPGGRKVIIIYEYTPAGDRSMIKTLGADGQSETTRYKYDQLGRVIEISTNGVKQMVYRYDPQTARLADKWLVDGTRMSHVYDERGRLQSITFFNTENTILKVVHYGWDERGQLRSRKTEIPDALLSPKAEGSKTESQSQETSLMPMDTHPYSPSV